MRFGLSFPNFGSYGEPGALVALARRAEKAGWEGFFVWDHVLVADSMPVADPWVVLGAIAQTTSSIRLGPMVAALPRHRPWNVARQAVSLDRLSKGRMILGVGIGFPPREEFGTFHEPQDPRVRADMLDEGLSIVEGVWSGQAFAHNGRHYQIEQTAFAPPPLQEPRIPIWVAASLPHRRPLRRAAHYDGVFPIRADMGPIGVEEFVEMKAYVDSHRTDRRSFDYVIGDGPRSCSELEVLEETGLTWYVGGPDPEMDAQGNLTSVSEGPAAYQSG